MESSSTALNIRTIFDPETCTRKGLCPVSSIRNKGDPLESHSLYFEQHGNGPEKVIFITGLNSTSFSWNVQVAHLARIPKYSVLVFDNRGVGNSGTPRGPYTTGGMAEDVIALLNYVGWTEHRDLHVVGISLGGMIAQELASRIPERIISLMLIVTLPGSYLSFWSNFPSWTGFRNLLKLTFTKDQEAKIPLIQDNLYPQEWLDQKDESDPQGRTNREVNAEEHRRRVELIPPQTMMGTFSQMAAALTHHVQPDTLRRISKSVPKVLILTGDRDYLVDPSNSFRLKEYMPEAEFVQWENTGHGIHIQHKVRFNAVLEKVFEEGRERVEGGFSAD